MRAIFLAAALLVGLVPASAAPFVNGSFESGPNPGSFITLGAGNNSVTGWLAGGAGVDYIGNYWVASDGNRSLDLSALSAGSISQTFDTVVGAVYTINFDLAGNPGGPPTIKQVQVLATGGTSQDYFFDITGRSEGNMGWTNQTYNFTATSASTTLSFTSFSNSASGPALDNVRVSFVPPTGGEVPEPTTFAMMGAGAALMFAVSRRRRK